MAENVKDIQLQRSESLGFGFSILGGAGSDLPPVICDIVENSPADHCDQLNVGDVIVAVNDAEVTHLTTKEVLKCLKCSGSLLRLKLRSDPVVRQRAERYLTCPPEDIDTLRGAISQQDVHGVESLVVKYHTSPGHSPKVLRRKMDERPILSGIMVPTQGPFNGKYSAVMEAGPPERKIVRHDSFPRSCVEQQDLDSSGATNKTDESGANSSSCRFETFVMTGDMIIRTSSPQKTNLSPKTSPSETKSESFDLVADNCTQGELQAKSPEKKKADAQKRSRIPKPTVKAKPKVTHKSSDDSSHGHASSALPSKIPLASPVSPVATVLPAPALEYNSNGLEIETPHENCEIVETSHVIPESGNEYSPLVVSSLDTDSAILDNKTLENREGAFPPPPEFSEDYTTQSCLQENGQEWSVNYPLPADSSALDPMGSGVTGQSSLDDLPPPPDDIIYDDNYAPSDVNLDDLPPPPAELLLDLDPGLTSQCAIYSQLESSAITEDGAVVDSIQSDLNQDNVLQLGQNEPRESSSDALPPVAAVQPLQKTEVPFESEHVTEQETTEPYVQETPSEELPSLSKDDTHIEAQPSDKQNAHSIVVSKSAEKISKMAAKGGPSMGGVRSSRSHENCLEGNLQEMTLVNIDFEDNMASSVDALHYQQSCTSLDQEHEPTSKSLNCSPERKTFMDKHSEKIFMPTFISLEEPRSISRIKEGAKPREFTRRMGERSPERDIPEGEVLEGPVNPLLEAAAESSPAEPELVPIRTNHVHYNGAPEAAAGPSGHAAVAAAAAAPAVDKSPSQESEKGARDSKENEKSQPSDAEAIEEVPMEYVEPDVHIKQVISRSDSSDTEGRYSGDMEQQYNCDFETFKGDISHRSIPAPVVHPSSLSQSPKGAATGKVFKPHSVTAVYSGKSGPQSSLGSQSSSPKLTTGIPTRQASGIPVPGYHQAKPSALKLESYSQHAKHQQQPDRSVPERPTLVSDEMTSSTTSTSGSCMSNGDESHTDSNTDTSLSPSGPSSPESPESDLESMYHQPMKDVDRPSAMRLAKRLFHMDGFKKSDVSRHLSKKNDFALLVGEEYLKLFDFSHDTLDLALRKFLQQVTVAGETQERERVLIHFSKRFMQCNPGAFNSEDACHTLTCALMLLNTDLHGQNLGRKMSVAEFIENLSDLNDGENFPREILKSLYHAIRDDPLQYELDDDHEDSDAMMGDRRGLAPVDQRFIGYNPFLEIPDPSKTTEYKKGYVMRKCCIDPDGKKTPMGKRGWKMFYVTLRDMVLYLHKDEHACRKSSVYENMSNAIRIHHALATKASDYTKKQHVFRLHTSDWAQYLFQTSNSKELQDWIDTINAVAASLSAPPLPGAVGAQRKFQRPLLPSSYTRLNMKEQMEHHERRVALLEQDLLEHRASPPEKGTKTRVIQDYTEKEEYLQYELRKFKTYAYLLRSKIASFTEYEPSLVETAIGEVDEPPASPSYNTRLIEGASSATSRPSDTKPSRPVQRSMSDRAPVIPFINLKDIETSSAHSSASSVASLPVPTVTHFVWDSRGKAWGSFQNNRTFESSV